MRKRWFWSFKHVALILLFSSTVVGSLFAQVGGAAVVFQEIVTDPVSRALGEATVAMRGYPGAAGINPATIGRQGKLQLSSNVVWDAIDPGLIGHVRTPWLTTYTSDDWLAVPNVDVKVGRWAAAYQYKHFDLGPHQARDAQNNPAGTFDSYDRSHKLSVAYDVRPRLSVGVGLNLIRSKRTGLGVDNQGSPVARATSFDFGVRYGRAVPVPHVQLFTAVGLSLTDFGSKIKYGDLARDPLPTRLRAGVSFLANTQQRLIGRSVASVGVHLALSKQMIHGEWNEDSQRFEFDGPFKALFTTWQPVDPSPGLETGSPTLSVIDQLVRHAGLSLSLLDVVSVRWGSFHEHRYNGNHQYRTIGWGVDLYYVALDHSKINHIEAGRPLDGTSFWRLTARVPLTDDTDNPWRKLWRLLR